MRAVVTTTMAVTTMVVMMINAKRAELQPFSVAHQL
jgi:hypothetical protein